MYRKNSIITTDTTAVMVTVKMSSALKITELGTTRNKLKIM